LLNPEARSVYSGLAILTVSTNFGIAFQPSLSLPVAIPDDDRREELKAPLTGMEY